VNRATSHSKRNTIGPKKSSPARRKERRIELINSQTGERIGIFDDVVSVFRANSAYLRQKGNETITIIKEVESDD
jgi:hypothetical protein